MERRCSRNFAEPEFIARLRDARSNLVAGAGGGFDVFSGLPLYLFLRSLGKEVHLANLSFTNLAEVRGVRVAEHTVKIDADTGGPEHYFPERALARWFRDQGTPISIYCFEKVGVRPLKLAYQQLHALLSFDAVVLVDGGTDILMCGDEADLGTPQEDLTSVAAVSYLDVQKTIVCLGFGIDRHHGVCHAHFLENVASLSQQGGFLGTFSLTGSSSEVTHYLEAVAFSQAQMPAAPSVVSTSIASAISGRYGDYHATRRTHGSKLWINPLMSMYWGIDLDAVAQNCLYFQDILNTETAFEVCAIIEGFRHHAKLRPRFDIPV